MLSQDMGASLREQVLQAVLHKTTLRIVAGHSKDFFGGAGEACATLSVAGHAGVIDYDPSERVITARAASGLKDISDLLSQHQQMLGFEPPDFAGQASLGGTLACGFSGPRRPFAGSARDFVLGCKIINGQGEVLNFGGRVMKNVAGFDVSRLMVGALGTLGVLLEVSIRVIPMPEAEMTLSFIMNELQAIQSMQVWQAKPWPISALAYDGHILRLRISGAEKALSVAASQLGGDIELDGQAFWGALREQQAEFFRLPGNLWRISVPAATKPMPISGRWLLDWGGALRWLKTDESAAVIHAAAKAAGGYALCFRAQDKSDWIRPEPGLMALQQSVRLAFDPVGIFNPGRLLPSH